MKPSRAMIPAEISWAYIALAFAWSGAGFWPFSDSYLNRILEKHEWEWLWLVYMGIPALALMIVSGREHFAHKRGRCNTLIDMDASARLRGRLSLALCFSWIYAEYVLVVVQKRPSALLLIAAGGAFFMFYAWVENRRVQRDVRKQTGTYAAPAAR